MSNYSSKNHATLYQGFHNIKALFTPGSDHKGDTFMFTAPGVLFCHFCPLSTTSNHFCPDFLESKSG